jgi:thiamine biosynthesis lipoprotein
MKSPRVLLPAHLTPGAPALGEQVHDLAGASMGTTWRVRVAGPAGLPLAALAEGIERVLARIVAQMSTWEPGSAISRYNRAAPGSWHALPDEFGRVMRGALWVAERSSGAFDPTAGPLVNAWGFGPAPRHDAPDFVPPDAARLAAMPMGWSQPTLDPDGRLRQPGGIALDLSAIAKGFAVDALAAYLVACRLPHHLVEVGGELRGQGVKPDGQPWWVELESPAAGDEACGLAPTRVALHGLAVATSGDYRRCYTHAGRQLSHTIDPRSRAPVAHGLASVTVLHAQCMLADAWSTALMVLGPRAGLALANAEGLAALLVWRQPGGGWGEAMSQAARSLCEA